MKKMEIIMEIREGEYKIQLTDRELKISETPFIESFIGKGTLRKYSRVYGREVIPTKEERIPIEKINDIQFRNKRLHIKWTEDEITPNKVIKEKEIKLEEYEANIIKEAVLKLKRGEDIQRIKKDYSDLLTGYREKISDTNEMITLEEGYIKIQNQNLQSITRATIPVSIYTPSMYKTIEAFTEKIPINDINKIELEEKNGATIKITLKNNRIKKIKFYSEHEKAQRLLNKVNRIIKYKEKNLQWHEKAIMTYKRKEINKLEAMLLESSTTIIVLFLIMLSILTEIIGREMINIPIGITLSILITIAWRKLKER